MPLRPRDHIVGPARESAAAAMSFADAIGADRRTALDAYLDEVYRLAPAAGIDPAIVVVQSALETNNWRDQWWNERLNPAGIGITGDPQQNERSMTWQSGADAARGQLVHLALYALGKPLPAALAHHAHLDPRRDAIPAGNLGAVRTVAALGGTWAAELDYGDRIANRSRDVFPHIPDQQREDTDMALEIEVNIARNRIGAPLRDREAWITVHENGNPASDARDEREFVKNGGGDAKVAYHFAVDQDRVVQILPLDSRGKHSGNADGNASSIAIETSQKEPNTPANQTQENLRALLVAIVNRDEGIDFGDGGYEFSVDRIRGHFQWPGANPNCPERMLAAWGGTIKPLVDDIRVRLAGRHPIGPLVEPHPVEGPHETKVVNGHLLWKVDEPLVAPVDILGKEWADPEARNAPDSALIRAGQPVDADYVLVGADRQPWLVTGAGWRIPARLFAAR